MEIEQQETQANSSSSDDQQITTKTSQKGKRNEEEEIEPGEALNLMFKYFDNKFNGMKEELDKNSLKPAPKKLKTESKSFSFKRKGNRKQHEFNHSIIDNIETIKQNIQQGDIDVAIEQLETTSTELKKRNKLIKIVDRSEAGWDVAEEYENDSVASYPDDSKRIRSADQRAIRKLKLKKTRYAPTFEYPSTSFSKPQNSQFRNVGFNHGYTPPIHKQQNGYFNGYQTNQRTTTSFRSPRSTDVCLGCGQQGHWRRWCPNINNHTAG